MLWKETSLQPNPNDNVKQLLIEFSSNYGCCKLPVKMNPLFIKI